MKPIIKISKYNNNINLKENLNYIIYPYIKNNNKIIPYTEKELKENFPKTYKYLLLNKTELEKRDLRGKTKWYEYGRM